MRNQSPPTKQEWQNAVKSRQIEQVKDVLKQGFLPDDLNEKIAVDHWSAEALSPIEILLRNNNLGQDSKCFDRADNLLNKGAKLPEEKSPRNKFSTTAEYFSHLTSYDNDLYIALRKNPALINEQDEEGKTLVHHAASLGLVTGSNGASLIHYLLFTSPHIDLSIKDKNGDTPIHVAAKFSYDRVTCHYIFPNYVRWAHQAGFYFDTLNNQGQSVLHIAARTGYKDPRGIFPRVNNVKNVLDIVPNMNVNQLSASSGSSALFYAINWLHLADAKSLLDAGANPHIGAEDRKPLAELEKQLGLCGELLSSEKAYFHADSDQALAEIKDKISRTDRSIFRIIAQLQALKAQMLSNTNVNNNNNENDPKNSYFWADVDVKNILGLESESAPQSDFSRPNFK